MWKIGEHIGDKEGRMDACVAAAGVHQAHTDCLEYPAEQFRQVSITYTFCLSSYLSTFLLVLLTPRTHKCLLSITFLLLVRPDWIVG